MHFRLVNLVKIFFLFVFEKPEPRGKSASAENVLQFSQFFPFFALPVLCAEERQLVPFLAGLQAPPGRKVLKSSRGPSLGPAGAAFYRTGSSLHRRQMRGLGGEKLISLYQPTSAHLKTSLVKGWARRRVSDANRRKGGRFASADAIVRLGRGATKEGASCPSTAERRGRRSLQGARRKQ